VLVFARASLPLAARILSTKATTDFKFDAVGFLRGMTLSCGPEIENNHRSFVALQKTGGKGT
jgi:hypothetical protein